MFSENECSVCTSKEVKTYCCCQQLFLCSKCENKHASHLMLSEEELMSFSISSKKSSVAELRMHLVELVNDLESYRNKILPILASRKLSIKDENLPPVLFNLKIHPILQITDSAVYLSDRNNRIVRYSFVNKRILDLNIQIDTTLVRPFWLLNWKQYLILIGGCIGLNRNNSIYQICLKTNRISEIIQMQRPNSLFYPIIYRDNLYVIGGRCGLVYSQRKVSSKIICYPLNDINNHYEIDMIHERYAVAACLHNDKIYIISYNKADSLDVFDPESDTITSLMLRINFEFKMTYGAAMISYGNEIYLFTQERFIKINEENECSSLIVPESISEQLSDEEWNQSAHPVIFDGKIFCFSKKGYFIYEPNTKSIEYKCLLEE